MVTGLSAWWTGAIVTATQGHNMFLRWGAKLLGEAALALLRGWVPNHLFFYVIIYKLLRKQVKCTYIKCLCINYSMKTVQGGGGDMLLCQRTGEGTMHIFYLASSLACVLISLIWKSGEVQLVIPFQHVMWHIEILMLQYSTTAQIKNKGVSMNKTKGSGAEAPIHKEPPGAGPYS